MFIVISIIDFRGDYLSTKTATLLLVCLLHSEGRNHSSISVNFPSTCISAQISQWGSHPPHQKLNFSSGIHSVAVLDDTSFSSPRKIYVFISKKMYL